MSEEQTELVVPGRFGVTNKQLIPVLKQAVVDQDVNKLILLKRNICTRSTNRSGI